MDLNADLGEGFGAWRLGDDQALLAVVSSANVACGFHAGDPGTIRATIRTARRCGAAVGAHPSYPDRAGFGRSALARAPEQVRDDVLYQVGALWALCRAEGVPLVHVKPHGALYHAAARDRPLAEAVCQAVQAVDPGLVVVCLAGSPMAGVVRAAGLRCAEEAFADRGYAAGGGLVPRGEAGALLEDAEAAAERVSRLVRQGVVLATDGTPLRLRADTVCVHGDTPGAERIAAAVRRRLERDGVELRAPAH
jgi:5-oxoprolinase (ATP-hydrolysing) subunit A